MTVSLGRQIESHMNCYIINLDRSTDRFSYITRCLAASNLSIVRVSAVSGDHLGEAELAHWQSRARVWAPLTAREIACFLSHRKTWKLVVESNEQWAFIGEDDIHVTRDFARFFDTADWLPETADIVKAETMRSRVEMSAEKTAVVFGHALRRLKSEHLGAAGYFISRKACERLLDLTEGICEPMDYILFSPRVPIAQLEIHQIDPALCVQDQHLVRQGHGLGFVSLIPLTRYDKVPPTGLRQRARRLWRELQRPALQFAAFLHRAYLRATGRSVFKFVPIDLERMATGMKESGPLSRGHHP